MSGSTSFILLCFVFALLGSCYANFGGGHPPASGDWVDYCKLGFPESWYCNNITPPTTWPTGYTNVGWQPMMLSLYWNTFLLSCTLNGMTGYLTAVPGTNDMSVGPLSIKYNNQEGESQLFFKTEDGFFVNIVTQQRYKFINQGSSNTIIQKVSLTRSDTGEYLMYEPSAQGGLGYSSALPDAQSSAATWTVTKFPPPEYKVGSYYIQSKVKCNATGEPLFLTLANSLSVGRTHLNTSKLITDKDAEALQLFRIVSSESTSGKWVGIVPLLAPDFKLDFLNWGSNNDISVIIWAGGWHTNETVQANQRWNVEIPMRGEWGQIILEYQNRYLFCMGERTEVVAEVLESAPAILEADLWRFVPYPLPPASVPPSLSPNITCPDDCGVFN